MANKDPSRTEAPTAKRIEDARKKGNVLRSEEIGNLAAVTAGLFLCIPTAYIMVEQFDIMLYKILMEVDITTDWSIERISEGFMVWLGHMAIILGPFFVGLCVVVIVAGRAQIGPYFEVGAMEFKPEQLNPASGMKQVVPNMDNTMKLLLIIGKLLIIGTMVWITIKGDLATIAWLPLRGLEGGVSWVFGRVIIITAIILTLLVAIAVLDYIWRRKQYMDNLMMTKQEVKDEHKNMDGDPAVKGRIRQKMREFSMQRVISEVPKADVIVTNPTHVAVALQYKPGFAAPIVLAKGLRKRALRIRQIAKQHRVPIVEAPPVARALYRTTKHGQMIPEHLFSAVAAILAKIFQQRKLRRFKQEQKMALNLDELATTETEPLK